MSKPTKWHMRPSKTQISLGIRPVWPESSLSAVRMKKHWVLSYPLSAQRRLWSGSDWTDAQADLSLRWAHMPLLSCRGSFVSFSPHSSSTPLSVILSLPQNRQRFCICLPMAFNRRMPLAHKWPPLVTNGRLGCRRNISERMHYAFKFCVIEIGVGCKLQNSLSKYEIFTLKSKAYLSIKHICLSGKVAMSSSKVTCQENTLVSQFCYSRITRRNDLNWWKYLNVLQYS